MEKNPADMEEGDSTEKKGFMQQHVCCSFTLTAPGDLSCLLQEYYTDSDAEDDLLTIEEGEEDPLDVDEDR